MTRQIQINIDQDSEVILEIIRELVDHKFKLDATDEIISTKGTVEIKLDLKNKRQILEIQPR